MAVISLLTELYQFAELKLNLKFEIEILCKALDVDLDVVQATTILRYRSCSSPQHDRALALDQAVYKDPHKFWPERYLPENGSEPHPTGFGYGRR